MKDASRAWDTVRRALGRFVAQTAVRGLPASDLTPPVRLRAADLSATPPALPGTQEHRWQPAAEVRLAAIPQAAAGTGDDFWRPIACVGAGEAASAPPSVREMPVVRAQTNRTVSADLLLPAFVVRLPETFLALPPSPVRVRAVPLPTLPGAGALRGWGIEPPKSAALRLPPPAVPRVRWGSDAVLSRISLARRGLEPPPEVPFALAFGAQAARLAAAAQLPAGEVTLVGIYPGVPLLAVRRIVVAEEGRLLHLWLKPEVLRERGATRLVTLLVGRQTSTGKMLQAVL